MAAEWIRRNYDGIGVTQYRPGQHLREVQDHYLGKVLLCIDVSGSMSGEPLRQAVMGGLGFVKEALDAAYRCGLLLWSDKVDVHVPLTAGEGKVLAALHNASICGGTRLAPALHVAIAELAPLAGDRVCCIFSDGDISDTQRAAQLAERARSAGIRFVVRGLGACAAAGLSDVVGADGDATEQVVTDIGHVRGGIASMARSLRGRSR
jgi:von Willebrand factor type A domain